jgi:hypothetical protein
MEQVFNFILDGLVFLALYIIFAFLLHISLYSLEIRDKIALNIKLPKRKRFLTKVDPIYELLDDEWNGWCIRKWELGYDDANVGLLLLMHLIPYPVNLLQYKYTSTGKIYLNDVKYTDIDVSLKEYYEAQWFIENAERLEIDARKKELKNKRDNLNKVFNENYE